MADTGDLVGRLDVPGTFHTLVFNDRGARRAVESGARSVRLVVSASDGHSEANGGVPTAEALDRLDSAAEILGRGDPDRGARRDRVRMPVRR
ncbi:beta/alpha barrel domain-containing protein [Amycolatopsis alkalitolerans]|uniref:hypothetical protein n=1 Tax=Amycolatopsis alkalitolerans TaxID=2547244 RepID=UPI001F21CC27|nr:hypothetical protein [Amycolatopsis alkalitolerans]